MEDKVSENQKPDKSSPARGVLKEIGRGLIIGAIVGALGGLLFRIIGSDSPPLWVFVIAGALATFIHSLIAEKRKRAAEKDG